MLEELATQIVKTLVSELKAVTEDGQVDHKARLAALKEARNFVTSLIPKMNKEDRERFSHAMSVEMANKMDVIKEQEKILEQYGNGSGNKESS